MRSRGRTTSVNSRTGCRGGKGDSAVKAEVAFPFDAPSLDSRCAIQGLNRGCLIFLAAEFAGAYDSCSPADE